MSEAEAEIDALLEGVKLEGEDEDKPAEKGGAKKDDKAKPDAAPKKEAEGKDERAEDINKRLHEVLEKHLPNPEAAQLMVDILNPGLAVVNLDWNLTPAQHALLAFGGIAGVALATNPEAIKKLRDGLKRKKDESKKDAAKKEAAKRAALPAKATPAAT